MTYEGLDDEADLLAQKEEWARSAADLVAQSRDVNYDLVLASARWACLWVDDFKELLASDPPANLEEAKALIERSRSSSLERSDGITRYPTGVPTMLSTVAAHDVFCMAFGDEADNIRQLMESMPE